MNNKVKGVLHMLLVVIVICLCGMVAWWGILPGKDDRGSAKNIRLGIDLAGGVSVTYEASKANPTEQELTDTVYRMQKRVEDISTEAAVYSEGENRITVDVPDVEDPQAVLDKLGQAGSMEFILYENLKDKDGNANPSEGDEVVFDEKNVLLDGGMISTASAETQQDQNTGVNENVVKLTLNGKGTKKFATVTSEHVNERLAIVYDGKMVSAPNIQSEISDGVAIISGNFDQYKDAEDMASVLRIGALPLELKAITNSIVGAKLGVTALQTSLLAGLIGLILVIIFMIAMYRVPGVASSIALIFYVGAMLLALNVLDVTLTLPGIAGIILSVGMAVDANVIIFTRIKEEIATGKTVRSAIKLGFDKALSAIIDGNVTTLIAAVVLWFLGSGTVKGFAQTLAIGIILSMITALFVTKFILTAFCNLGLDKEGMYGVQKERKTIHFCANFKKYIIISSCLFALCIGGIIFNMATRGTAFNLSLDFVGGTSTSVSFDANTKATDTDTKKDVEALVKSSVNKTAELSTVDNENKIVIRTTELSEDEQATLQDALMSKYGIAQDKIELQSISATVSNEMQRDAVFAVIIAALCMLVYIWIRFKNVTFGASSVMALIHDVIVVIMVYAVFSYFIQVGNTFIACLLTIVGYSINATIVVFDRIRENQKKAGSRAELAEVVDNSVTQTVSRSINTSLTTFVMVFVLAIMGVDSVRQFAIPLIAGIICGCYSSVCLAGTIWYQFNKKKGVARAGKSSKKRK